MTLRPSPLVDQLTTRPVIPTPDLTLASPSNLPALIAPPPDARALFALADRLVDGMHEASRGKGQYPGRSWPEVASQVSPIWATGMVFGIAAGLATAIGWENPGPFLVGLVAGVAASIPAVRAVESWAARTRSGAVPVSEAEPYLLAFKGGDPQVQALVKQLAASASDTMAAHVVAGEELRSQLAEIAAVNVSLDPEAARRVTAMRELALALPRRDREAISCRAIETAFERLEPADRRAVAPQLLSYLFRGERLRWKLLDSDAAERLRAKLVGRKVLASREELQKLVAPAPTRASVVPDSGGDV